MAGLGDLFVNIRATAAGYSTDIKAISRETKALEKDLKPIGDLAKGMGLAFVGAGGVVTGALGLMVRNATAAGDAMRDMSIRTGATVEQLSVLGFAAEQNGATLADVGTGLRFLSRNAVEAAEGGKKQALAFQSLGIALKDSAGAMRPMNDVLLDVADRFKGTRDGAEKSALAIELFGRGGTALIPVLNEGSEGIRQMGLELDAVGGIMTTELADASDRFNEQMNLNNKAMAGLSQAVTSALLPALTSMAGRIAPLIADVTRFADANRNLTLVIGGTAAALTGTGGLLVGLGAVASIIPTISKGLSLLAAHPVVALAGAFVALGSAAFAFRNELAAGILSIQSFITGGLAKLSAAAASVAKAAGLQALGDKLLETHFALLNTADSAADMARVLAAGEPVIIGNTDAVKKFLEKQKEAPALLKDSATEAAKLTKEIKDLTDQTANLHKELESAGRAATWQAMIRENEDLQASLEHTNEIVVGGIVAHLQTMKSAQVAFAASSADLNSELIAGLGRVTDARVKEILRGRVEDQRNFDEQLAIEKKKMDDAVSSIKNSAGQVFDAMLIKGQNVFTSLANALKGGALSLGRAIFEDVSGQLLGPIKLAFDTFFKGLLQGSGISGFIQGLGAKLGGLLGGIGGGAPAIAGGFLPVFGGAGGGAAGGSAGGLFGIGGAAGVNGAAIAATAGIAAAAVGAIAFFKSQAHHEANTFVKGFQDPFANDKGTGFVNKIVDTFDAAEAAGTLTKRAAEEALASVTELWTEFKAQTADFAKGGSDEAKVAAQALSTLAPLMTQIFTDMGATINTLADEASSMEDAVSSAAVATQALAEEASRTQQFIDQVVNAADGAMNLAEALSALESMGSPAAIIMDRLGSDIQGFFDILTKSGLVVPELIEKYNALLDSEDQVIAATASMPVPRGRDGSQVSVDSAEQVRAFMQALAGMLGGGGQTLVLQVDGRTLGTIVAPHSFALARNLGVKVTGSR